MTVYVQVYFGVFCLEQQRIVRHPQKSHPTALGNKDFFEVSFLHH